MKVTCDSIAFYCSQNCPKHAYYILEWSNSAALTAVQIEPFVRSWNATPQVGKYIAKYTR